jgi:hypothetical protein
LEKKIWEKKKFGKKNFGRKEIWVILHIAPETQKCDSFVRMLAHTETKK